MDDVDDFGNLFYINEIKWGYFVGFWYYEIGLVELWDS